MEANSDQIEILEVFDGYVIAWIVDGDQGATVGEGHVISGKGGITIPSKNDFDDFESFLESWTYWTCEIVAAKENKHFKVSDMSGGFVYESKKDAQAVLKKIRAALSLAPSAPEDAPMPPWAQEAIALGWTPPKPKKKKRLHQQGER